MARDGVSPPNLTQFWTIQRLNLVPEMPKKGFGPPVSLLGHLEDETEALSRKIGDLCRCSKISGCYWEMKNDK